MARIQNQRASQRNDVRDGSRAALRKKKNKDQYKIVLEAVTQEKKKLHSILTYASNAPDGFGFIPAGHPEFTEWCKEQCRQRNLDVHIVSAKPKNKTHTDPAKLSHHVHRVGHHFPMRIVNLACSKFGYDYDIRKGLRKTNDRENWIAQRFEAYSSRQANQGGPTTERETKMYIHDAVREMFPKIPEADLQAIVDHAFEEGTDRVGNAKGLSLARRVQLAVVAHIRHMYTDYDKLLKSDGWQAARAQVEHVSLAKLKEWRDEAGEQSNELEETFRETNKYSSGSPNLGKCAADDKQDRRTNLQPIGQVGGGSRSKYEPPYTAARSAPGYVQPSSSRFSSFDRSSAPARRPSDQDVALPSVERETIDLTSPRRIPAYQQPVQNHEAPTRSYDDVHAYKRKVPSFTVDDERLHPERLIKRPMLVHREEAYTRTHKNGVPEFHPNQQTGYYSAPRGAPPEPVIDLTSSPDGRDRPPPRRSAVPAGLRGYAYHPEVPAGEPSRSYMSDTRLYERRAPPAHDNPFQDGRQPFPAPRDDVRYTRNGSRYGG
ncbi:DUF2293 domain-containing protein [Pyrenophora tritici-repentis]|nr:DUF2293 domain-containing protein [Pyrenophora tritici-repentis]KAI0613871.1 DUF2293 domain-containing protein [Pyrenophora tritici-repentis]KAI1586286.1 repeatdomain containing protein [Pyrenophora tritici-repentis]PZD00732.1 DUF2293 domain containing protein [Pyrenophora tritici-repentis]PZD33700.1 DUF2293 domain containing protein [Pyrenophora tritici-repentis]